jgi:hypothetical protein
VRSPTGHLRYFYIRIGERLNLGGRVPILSITVAQLSVRIHSPSVHFTVCANSSRVKFTGGDGDNLNANQRFHHGGKYRMKRGT